MGKKKVKAPRPRTDAERRSRQCERMARMLRTLKCIMGPGRWDAQALAQELECSTRTVQRILQTLSMAGVPCRYDADLKAYRVPFGFKFPGLETGNGAGFSNSELVELRELSRRLLREGGQFLSTLRKYYMAVNEDTRKIFE